MAELTRWGAVNFHSRVTLTRLPDVGSPNFQVQDLQDGSAPLMSMHSPKDNGSANSRRNRSRTQRSRPMSMRSPKDNGSANSRRNRSRT
jgi:hypothetical protein